MLANNGRPLANSPKSIREQPSHLRKRDHKWDQKELLQNLQGARRKMSLDFDYVDKVKSSDLKNILREKLAGYLSNPYMGT
jgi:hypothetical protein